MDEETQEFITLGEVVTTQADDPSVEAARNMDWQAFVQTQEERSQAILRFIAEGRKLKEVAQRVKLSPATISQRKKRLAAALVEFMGTDVPKEVNRKPQWTDNLNATKERMACKVERQRI